MSKTTDSRPSASLFSLPLAPWQQPRSLRTLACEFKRKRSSHDDGDDHDAEDQEEEEGYDNDINGGIDDRHSQHGQYRTVSDDLAEDRHSVYSSRAPSSQVLTPDEQRQFIAAGLDLDSELPGDQFPHRAPTLAGPRSYNSYGRIHKGLSKLREPVYDPIPTGRRSLRLQHLAVITAILHRCLMAGDYVRAGRAWGLILRDSFGGIPVQVKYTARWGIGAEVLLWSGFDRKSVLPPSEESGDAPRRPPYRQWFTREGFEKAKDYYERLILHYPYSKSHPHSLNPLDFYPAMYGLWISIAQEESRTAREITNDDDYGGDDNNDSYMGDDPMELASDSGEVAPRKHTGQRKKIIDARAKELAEAEKIASELDKILLSPPYSDSPRLLELRGMISQWIGDLHVSSITADDPDNMPADDVQLSLDYRRAIEQQDKEIAKAEEFFERAKKRNKVAASRSGDALQESQIEE